MICRHARGHGEIAVGGAAQQAGRDPGTIRIVCRGVVRPGTRGPLLSGSPGQIRADAAALEEQGVTELFYDLNFDPRIGSPDVDPAAATAHADELLVALAPD